MITKRIIACLDVRDGRVVKGVQFVDIIDAGDPATQAARHARDGADVFTALTGSFALAILNRRSGEAKRPMIVRATSA